MDRVHNSFLNAGYPAFAESIIDSNKNGNNMKNENKYAIKSKITGQFLSNLFEDSHNKTYQAKELNQHDCYFWNIKSIALNIASKENGIVYKCKFLNNKFCYGIPLNA